MTAPNHDTDKPKTDGEIEEGCLWGVVAKPIAHGIVTAGRILVRLTSKSWTPAPMAAKLGFPLQLCSQSTTNPADLVPDTQTPTFFWDTDIDSPDFGNHHTFENKLFRDGRTYGPKLFTRTDGKHMEDLQLEYLCRYIGDILQMPIFKSKLAKLAQSEGFLHDLERVKGVLRKSMRPEAFHAWFEEHNRLQVLQGRSDVQSPVSVTFGAQPIAPACGSCFGGEGKDGQPLVKCGGCGKRFYCDKKCQKEDWKTHKTVCSRAK